MIIGVTGFYGSGKDTVISYLQQQGFFQISLSDVIRDELKERNMPISRENEMRTGNELREKYGSAILAYRALKKMDWDKNWAVNSIRNPVEVEVLKEKKDFILIFVDAPIKERFKRVKERQRTGDLRTFEDFKKAEEKELHGTGSSQQLLAVKAMAEIVIRNDTTLEALQKKVDKFLLDIKKWPRFKRPTWDEYFIEITHAVAQRATCDRGKSGSVIVKDKRLLTTGYVGSAVGMPHCDEVGHLMHTVTYDDGSVHKHCVRTTHAEQNAILQAAKYGISINGATVYCKMTPCAVCAKMIINAGISRVVCERVYHGGKESENLFQKAGIKLEYIKKELQQYANQ